MFLYMVLWLCLMIAKGAASDCGEESNISGLTFKLYDNAALAHTPALQGLTLSAQLSLEEQDPEGNEDPCHLSAELLGTIGFAKAGVYQFDCEFIDTSTGWVWIDGHLVCGDNNAYRPDFTDNPADNPLPMDRDLPFRAHITTNDTSWGNCASLKVSWKEINQQEETEFQLLTDSSDVSLSPCLPPAEEKRDEFQRNLGYGWGAWLHHDMNSLVKLPESLVVTPKLCHISNNTCLEFVTPESDGTRVGLHAFGRSYVTYHMAYHDANLTMEYSVQDDQVYFLITPADLPPNSTDYEIRLSGRYAWYRPGEVETTTNPAGNQQLTFTTPGLGVVNVSLVKDDNPHLARPFTNKNAEARILQHQDGDPPTPEDKVFIKVPLGQQPVAFGVNLPPTTTTQDVAAKVQAAREAEQTRIRNKFGDAKYAVAEAIQSTVMWTLIYNPLENQGLLMPVSRVEFWTFFGSSGAATTDWTYVIFDWDNIFASLLAGLDNKDIAYSNLFQVIKAKTAAGFVPNLSTGGFKSQDRTEPTIGAKVMLELFRKYNDTWAVEVVLDDLIDWNNWSLAKRILEPAGLIALGSHAASFGPHKHLPDGSMGSAKDESGMDNSPMYDGEFFDPESHMMQLYDVGMSSLFVQEAYSLAELADAVGRDATVGKKLRARGDAMRDKIRAELWDPEQEIFANRFPNGTFSNRISPTSFYPLFTGAASPEQAESMAHHWLLNASRFCLSPTGDFDGNDPNGCYYGLPSISADDPAFMAGDNYWRGLTWGPLAMITFWGLQEAAPATTTESNVTLARQALCEQMETLMMSQWNAHRHICENYHPSRNHTGENDCTGTKFYHWGALTGLIGMMEDGHW